MYVMDLNLIYRYCKCILNLVKEGREVVGNKVMEINLFYEIYFLK